MLTHIHVVSENEFELPILGVTPKSSLLIKQVTGLNPPDRSLFIGEYSQDGGIYQGRRVGNRNLVLTIDLNPNPALGETVMSLRELLYRAFLEPQVDGDYLKIMFHDESDVEKYLVGYCEKFETEIFDSETMCQISMICPDPYLRNDEDTIITQTGGGLTKFPFTYEGSAEIGFIVRIYVTANTNRVTLSNNGKLMRLVNLVGTGYELDDLIMINTIRGQRSITLTKPADITSIPTEFTTPTSYAMGAMVYYKGAIWKANNALLGEGTTMNMAPGEGNTYWLMVSKPIVSHLLPSSQWLELHSADNVMKVYGGIDPDNIVANIKYLKYTSAYWGM